MRMWLVDPSKMCRQHLLGEHLEMHMFIGAIKKGTSIKGFIDKGLVSPRLIKNRHDELVLEMKNRGYNHQSPMDYCCRKLPTAFVDIVANEMELSRRCPKCFVLINCPKL